MTRTIEQVIARGGMMALDRALSLDHLAQAWPEVLAEAGERSPKVMATPERFHVERGVAVVPVRGVLTASSVILEKYFGWTTYRGLEETCDTLAADDSVQDVILDVNSGGGMVLGLKGAANALSRLAQSKPVHALVDTVGASAAYWLASQAGDISMTAGAVVGSIGVGVSSYAYVQPGGSGVQLFEFTSTHARAKWPDPSTEEGRAEIQRDLDATEAEFHDAVSSARGMSRDELTAILSVTDDPRDGGAVFGPADAMARSLADRMETRAEFFTRLIGAAPTQPRSKSRASLARARVALATSQM
ncbi:S49 family peptidase [Celeribacter naphthalenivorans]|uniref:S49 family peptidase n=1 Tax=Celeribacter naphthalenivorans TaxID=1614694 RepID=UPI001CF938C4|nr:S49 family peptidase [Celeribacter naphthalenivorans]